MNTAIKEAKLSKMAAQKIRNICEKYGISSYCFTGRMVGGTLVDAGEYGAQHPLSGEFLEAGGHGISGARAELAGRLLAKATQISLGYWEVAELGPDDDA